MNSDENKYISDLKRSDSINLPETDLPRIVIIGAGFGGINFIKKIAKNKAQIVLIDKNNFHQFQPLLYQVATSGLEPDSILFPIRKLFKRYKNVFFRMAEVKEINPKTKTVYTKIGCVNYDYLIIANGTNTNFFGMEDIEKHCIGMKSIQEALDIRSMILENLEKAEISKNSKEREALMNFVVIGGGPTGVEIAGALAEFKRFVLKKDYPDLDAEKVNIFLLEGLDQLLNGMSDKASKKALKYLKNLGVDVRLETSVKNYDGQEITTNKEPVMSRTVIWTAGVKGNLIRGINPDYIVKGNRIRVNRYSQVEDYENLFAIGDIAAMISDEYPKGHPMLAQAAIQQGKHLAKNLNRKFGGKEMKKFEYTDKGALATIGRSKAVADLGKLKFGGFLAWLIWSAVHLFSISGFRNKLVVAVNWGWNYITYDRSNRLIIRKAKKAQEKNIRKTMNTKETREAVEN
ncbi:MAG: NAD(P)/FAD-dependent oxidoreductase [Brumimicrobium sp.]|nr:NAD(P)/FAD-dependent oxidoreductase [Brumimicrobium sp.]